MAGNEFASISEHNISFSQSSDEMDVLSYMGQVGILLALMDTFLYSHPALNPENADKRRIQKLSPQVRLEQWRGSFIIRALLEGHSQRLSWGLIAALLKKRELPVGLVCCGVRARPRVENTRDVCPDFEVSSSGHRFHLDIRAYSS